MQITNKSPSPSSNLFFGSWELQTKPRLLLLGVSKSTSPGLKLQIQTRLSKDSKQTTGMMTTNLCVFLGEGHYILPNLDFSCVSFKETTIHHPASLDQIPSRNQSSNKEILLFQQEIHLPNDRCKCWDYFPAASCYWFPNVFSAFPFLQQLIQAAKRTVRTVCSGTQKNHESLRGGGPPDSFQFFFNPKTQV